MQGGKMATKMGSGTSSELCSQWPNTIKGLQWQEEGVVPHGASNKGCR